MAHAILLPKQGQSVESCIITEFYVKAGDEVSEGTPLFAYETDKAAFDEEASADGVLLEWFFEEGDEVPVLTNVGVIGMKGESVEEFRPTGVDMEGVEDLTGEEVAAVKDSDGAEAVAREAVPGVEVSPSTVGIEASTVTSQAPAVSRQDPERIFISPRARNLAEKEGVEIETVEGSGPRGRIIESDIKKAVASKPRITPLAKKMIREEGFHVPPTSSRQRVASGDLVADRKGSGELAGAGTGESYVAGAGGVFAGPDSEIVPLTNIRKLIANAMHQSLQRSAQLTHHLGADARNILALRKKVKQAQSEGYAHNLTLNDMICFAVVKTLKAYPQANSHFLGDSVRMYHKVHLGLAVDTERGLMVPAIRNADDLSIEGLSSQMKEIAEACRSGKVDPDLLSPEAASFTVSNLGNYGVEMFTPVINLPQVAILGVNTILPRPKDLGDGVYGFVPHLGLSLTYDHQALDGGEATRFLKEIATNIENLEVQL